MGVCTHKEWLRLEFLPAYSPDFNPIECLWRWMKTEHFHNRCWGNQADLKSHLVEVIAKMTQSPTDLTSIMRQEIRRLNIKSTVPIRCIMILVFGGVLWISCLTQM
jgi:transposase